MDFKHISHFLLCVDFIYIQNIIETVRDLIDVSKIQCKIYDDKDKMRKYLLSDFFPLVYCKFGIRLRKSNLPQQKITSNTFLAFSTICGDNISLAFSTMCGFQTHILHLLLCVDFTLIQNIIETVRDIIDVSKMHCKIMTKTKGVKFCQAKNYFFLSSFVISV